MSVKQHRILNPADHSIRIFLVDHFGRERDMTMHPVFADRKPNGETEYREHDFEPVVARAVKEMEDSEALHLKFLLKNFPDHPAAKAHPGHPDNAEKDKSEEMFPWPKPKNCKEC